VPDDRRQAGIATDEQPADALIVGVGNDLD
jgi:hypothetical protein